VVWIEDGDLDALDAAARRYREIVGPPDSPPDGGDGAADHGGASGSEGGGEGDHGQAAEASGPGESGAGGAEAPGSVAEALGQAIAHARSDQLVQLDEDVDLQQLLERVAGDGAPDRRDRRRGRGTGAPQGRLPDRGVDRPPFADEAQSARRYATRLQREITIGTREIDKRTPGGRFDGRAHARGQAQRAAGRPITTDPWRVTRAVRASIHAPHVLLVIDTSGSMAAYEYALGPIAWILSTGLRAIDGRLAIALFGDAAALLSDGREPLRMVPGLRTGGGTAFAGDALCLAADALDMTDPRRVRLAYCLSDGGWYDTRAGVEKIRWLAGHGVPTVHLAIGAEPLSVEAERIVVLDDPADALDRIADDTVAALQTATRARRR
jgi:Mg-chelatase subunit ChlD